MRALVGFGVALGVALGVVGCSSGDAGSGASARVETGVTPQAKKPRLVPSQVKILILASAPGVVSGASFFSDGSGNGIGILCLSVDASGNCNNVPVALIAEYTYPELHSHSHAELAIPSMPNGLNGEPWTGDYEIQLEGDPDQPVIVGKIVQLVGLTGQDTLANAPSPWVEMGPSTTDLCISDTDCTLYGLDTTNGPYTCANNACTQSAPVQGPCVGDVICQ
jgi:hypothetical protein